jgi:predicted ABC-type exoprotein transport system permease subunit
MKLDRAVGARFSAPAVPEKLLPIVPIHSKPTASVMLAVTVLALFYGSVAFFMMEAEGKVI